MIVGKTSAQASDLTADQLIALKHKALDQGDRAASAQIYWYYRFTEKDSVEMKKWEYAVENHPSEGDGVPK